MNIAETKKMIKRHEGKRSVIYKDSLGFLTGGYGHAFLEGSPISYEVTYMLFEEDYARAVSDLDILCKKYNLSLDSVRQGVLINMLFNMGLTKVLKFRKMISALQIGDYKKAAIEMMDSTWAKQVGKRAVELSQLMGDGLAKV
jgi:lysozyme